MCERSRCPHVFGLNETKFSMKQNFNETKFSSDYTWSAHISTIAEEGRKMLSWILGIFQDRTRLTMLTLYKSMVRSKLEYCCPLWNPSSVAEMLKLERIERIFTSKVEGCRELPYWERLKYLRIQSLQRRRERYIIIHTWKI